MAEVRNRFTELAEKIRVTINTTFGDFQGSEKNEEVYERVEEFDKEVEDELIDNIDGIFDPLIEKAKHSEGWNDIIEEQQMKARVLPSPDLWNISRFMRGLTQKLGGVYEDVAKVIADNNDDFGEAETQRNYTGKISSEQQAKIEKIVKELKESGGRSPNWENEVEEVRNADNTRLTEEVSIIWDVAVDDYIDGDELLCEIKTPKPNKDQCMEAKRKMLRMVALAENEENLDPYIRFVFPFNPYGSCRSDYSHGRAMKIFSIEDTDCMLIEDEFWNALGGDGTWEGVKEIFGRVEDKIDELEEQLSDEISLKVIDRDKI